MNSFKIRIDLKRFDLLAYYMLTMSLVLTLIGKPIRSDSLVSFATTLTIIASLIQIVYFARNNQIRELKFFTSFIGVLVFSFLSFSIGNMHDYPAIVRLVCFLQIPLFISSISYKDCAYTNKFLYFVFTFVPLVYLALLNSEHAYEYQTIYGARMVPDLTLGYSNPNETAIYLFFTLIILLSALVNSRRKVFSAVYIVEIAFVIYLVFLTKCRSIEIIILFTILLWILREKQGFYRICIFLIHVFPFVIAPLAIIFNTQLSNINLFGDAIETGRVSYYASVFSNLNILKIIFGDYSFWFANLHNAAVSIFATIGIFGAICYYSMLYNRITNVFEHYSFQVSLSFIGLLLIVLHSSVESGVFTAGSVFAAFYVMTYRLAISDSLLRPNGC